MNLLKMPSESYAIGIDLGTFFSLMIIIKFIYHLFNLQVLRIRVSPFVLKAMSKLFHVMAKLQSQASFRLMTTTLYM